MLRRLFGRSVAVAPVTEHEACDAYLAHLHACPVCSSLGRADDQCAAGRQAHDTWKALERQQTPLALPPRRRAA